MAEITSYKYRVEPQDVDFTLRASVSSIINYMLNVAGLDAHNKGFGVEVLQGKSFTWVLSRLAIEVKRQPEQSYGGQPLYRYNYNRRQCSLQLLEHHFHRWS